jgi:hypothetical protein
LYFGTVPIVWYLLVFIVFWNCSNSVVFVVFHVILELFQ